MARIVIITASGEETVEIASGETLTVGRDPANRLPFPDAQGVSRRHCRIGPREGGEGGYEMVDLGSTNKTRVNGHVVDSRVLVHGDVIEAGSVRLRFEDPEEAKRQEQLGKEGVCFLEWIAGDRRGQRVPLQKPRTRIGRRDTNEIVLEDRMVSGHHAEIDRDLNGYTVRDLGSTNGTLVNGAPVTEALLTHGIRLRIGNSRFVFKDPAMQDVEVELSHLEEDEGWGMMGEIDLSRARGSKVGPAVVLLLFLAAAGGGWWLAQQGGKGGGEGESLAAGGVVNGSFEDEDVPWSSDVEEGVTVSRSGRGGRPGAFLSARNDAESGTVRVSYDAPFEGGGGRPLRFRAELKGAGDGVLFAVTWASEPTAEERKAGVTDLTRSDVLLRASEGWTALDETRYPPGWARTARLALLLPPGTGAGLDEVRVEREAAGATRPSVAVRTFKTATLEPDGSVDVLAQRTVLLTGVRPAARLASGAVLDRLRVDVPAEASEGALAFKGVLVGEEQEIPVTATWTTTEEGLRLALEAPGAAAVGLVAALPATHVGASVGVLGDFLPQRISARPGERVEKVDRVLIGDPAAEAGATSTLLAFVRPEGEPPATFEVLPSLDPSLVTFRHLTEGAQASVDLVTDFTGQMREAEDRLAAARSLSAKAPGLAIVGLRTVAQAYPFNPQIRDEAVRLADELETQARGQKTALEDALRDYGVYRSSESLVPMEQLAERLGAQFLGEGHPEGAMEAEIRGLVDGVRAARKTYDLEQAEPGVERLERLVSLLGAQGGAAGDRPLAALYARAMLRRYEHLVPSSPDLARRLEAARARLGELGGSAEVKDTLPPLPGEP